MNENNKKSQSDFKNQIKVETDSQKNSYYEKKKLIEKLTANPNLLKEFSNDRLERILQFYLDDNENKKKLLKKLKNSSK